MHGDGSCARVGDALIGAIVDSPADESVNHDHYLYGWPRRTRERLADKA